MPFLQQLSLQLKSGDDWSQLRLPATLHTISLVLPAEISAAVANGLISALCQHERLVSLSLRFSAPIPTAVSLAPLQSLPALIELGLIDLQSDDVPFLQLSPEQAQQLRALTPLQRLKADLDEATLLQLMEPPRNGQLQWIEWPCELSGSAITDPVAALMPSLPHLQTLLFNGSFCHVHGLDFLAQLPRLTSLNIDSWNQAGNNRHTALLLALAAPLPQITSFALVNGSELDTQQLRGVLTHFPQLRELRLDGVWKIDALTCLEPVRGTLRSLVLVNLFGLTPAVLHFLPSFGLTHLTLEGVFDEPLAPPLLQALTPPSTLIPTLQVLKYTSPDDDDDVQ